MYGCSGEMVDIGVEMEIGDRVVDWGESFGVEKVEKRKGVGGRG